MPKRMLEGVVVSDKQDKTVVVRVERRFTHPVLKKTVRRTKKYYAHDEKNEFSVGDVVRSRAAPLSRPSAGDDRGRQEHKVVSAMSAEIARARQQGRPLIRCRPT
jgi:small subunit ribosomal protein S17